MSIAAPPVVKVSDWQYGAHLGLGGITYDIFIKDGGGAQQVIEKNRICELFHIQKCFNSWKK